MPGSLQGVTPKSWRKKRMPITIAFLAMLVLTAAFVLFLTYYASDVRSDVRSHTENLLEPHCDAFSRAWDRRVLVLEGLRAFAESNLDGSTSEMGEKYPRFAAILHRQVEGIRGFSVAPGGVVAFVYPFQGNEMLIGHNLLGDQRPGAGTAVARTLASGEIALAGPYAQTIGGEPTFEAFGAIRGRDGFWGMVSSAIDVLPLLKVAGFDGLSQRLALAFRSLDGTVFWGDSAVFQNDPVIRHLEGFGQTLEVGALPVGGWRAAVLPQLTAVYAVGILGILAMTGAIFLFASRHSGLARTIRLRTAELALSDERFQESEKRAEKALRVSEEQLRLALLGTKDGLWDWDIKTDYVYFSPRWKSMLGYAEDELEDHFDTWKSLVHPEDLARTIAATRDLVAQRTDEFAVEFRMKHKDGHYRNILSRAFLVRNSQGEAVRLVGTHVDITERKRAEEALKTSQALLDKAQRLTHFGGWEMSLAELTLNCSDEIFRIFGVPTRDFHPHLPEFFQMVHPEDKPMVLEHYRESVETGKFRSYEYRIVRPDGSIRWVHSTGEADLNEQGVPIQIIGTLHDITDRKQEQEEKEKLETQLIQAQKMESIGRLAGGVAHDFNNMLSVILGCTELIKARAVLDGPASGYLQEITKAANRSRDITRQLLAFSRKQIIAPKTLKLNEHIHETRKILSRMIGEDLHLNFHPGKDLWTIKLDPFQLDQILMNLIVNARDAMPDGGTATIKTANVVIDTNYLEKHYFLTPGEFVVLEITDEGAGMDKETLRHMFEPFFTTKTLGQGTGLGLATVYGIVKQNNGFINAYSEPGEGTCFRVYFPRANGKEIPPAPEETQGLEGSETVLLVEDSQPVRKLIAGILEEIGFTVLAAETPAEAIILCEKKDIPIDILVTDVIMPNMNGAELGNKVAALRPGIKILFMSGYPEDFIAHRGVLKKEVHFIQKPFSMKDIADKIREIMREEIQESE